MMAVKAKNAFREVLVRASRRPGRPVRIRRRRPDGTGEVIDAFVHEVGAEWLLLSMLDYRLQLDGAALLRLADVAAVQSPRPQYKVVEESLRLRRLTVSTPYEFPGQDIRDFAAYFQKNRELISVYTEYRNPTNFSVGMVVAHDAAGLTLREVSVDAKWESRLLIKYDKISQLTFGEGYLFALAVILNHRRGTKVSCRCLNGSKTLPAKML